MQNEAVYGLTELARNEISNARLVANPGCYPTCAQLPPVYTLAAELGHRTKLPRQNSPALNRLAQVNWTLHTPQQQNRLGGWKESNMLYRGTLTYHS